MMSLFARMFPIGTASTVARGLPLLNGRRSFGSSSVHSPTSKLPMRPLPLADRRLGMHIVAIVLAVAAGAAVWWWRIKTIHEAGRDAADMVGRVRGAYRMRKFKKAAEGSVLATVDDPALAAAILLFTLAGERPPGTQPATTLVRFELGDIVPQEQLDEMMAYAEWAARSVADPRDCIRRFTDLWRRALTIEERNNLLEMAENIVGQHPEPHQQLCVDALRSAITNK
jgi:uncharacterized tellurite resistance protein B-like protein